MPPKILITGASGFIGGWIAETLFLSGDSDVRAGVRNWSGAVRLARFPMHIVLCDISNTRQITEAMTGVDWVIHCAKGSDRSIITGTKNILDAALALGIKRFIHLSTTEVYGNVTGEVDEMFPLQRTGNSYADAKIRAEELCRDYSARGLPVTVIRPPIVYGPFGKTWSVNIAQKIQSGNWGTFKRQGEGACNLIYISDLVVGILDAARSEHAVGQAFNLNGADTLTWNTYFARFNAALGLPPLREIENTDARARAAVMEPLRVSAKFARDHFARAIWSVATRSPAAKQMMKRVEAKMKTSPRPNDFALYNRRARYLATRAADTLGFKPRVHLDAGLALTVQWLDQVGLVNRN